MFVFHWCHKFIGTHRMSCLWGSAVIQVTVSLSSSAVRTFYLLLNNSSFKLMKWINSVTEALILANSSLTLNQSVGSVSGLLCHLLRFKYSTTTFEESSPPPGFLPWCWAGSCWWPLYHLPPYTMCRLSTCGSSLDVQFENSPSWPRNLAVVGFTSLLMPAGGAVRPGRWEAQTRLLLQGNTSTSCMLVGS